MKHPYIATNSMLPADGPDGQAFAVYWDGQYCESMGNDKELQEHFSFVWNVFDMDFDGGQNCSFWIKGRDFRIVHTSHTSIQVQTINQNFDFIHTDTRLDWVQLALVRRGEDLELWENGTKVSDQAISSTEKLGGGNILIGYTNADRYFRGYLFDCRIYNGKALTGEELQYLYTDTRAYQGERTLPRVNYGRTPKPSE